jgi:release factor glutamine methyltransferase
MGHDPDGDVVAWGVFLDQAKRRLGAAAPEIATSADIDARRIVEAASGFEGAHFHLGLHESATKRGVAQFDAMVERRLRGEPLQYVLGSWGFRTLDLLVDDRVLIPRPETEVVAGVALAELDRLASKGRTLTAVDLGTGSGAIGLSLASERPDTRVFMTDVSSDALAVARANLAGLGPAATRVTIHEGSWFAALPAELVGEVDVLVSNPPYVAPEDPLPAVVADWEPSSALIAADSGRADVGRIVQEAGPWLRPGGALVLEMAPGQTTWAATLAADVGFVDVEILDDLAGRPRAVRARWRV